MFQMVYDLSAHILSPGPESKNVYSHHLVLSVVYFLVDNCKYLFDDIKDSKFVLSKEGASRENNLGQVSTFFVNTNFLAGIVVIVSSIIYVTV